MCICRVKRSQVTEYEPHKFEAEASALGLRPGEWPSTLLTDVGNGQPFLVSEKLRSWGETCAVIYRQQFGCCELVIHND